jgi:hypothetical protein
LYLAGASLFAGPAQLLARAVRTVCALPAFLNDRWPFAGLAETKGLVDEQYAIVARLKRIGANTKQAICLLVDLLELQQMRELRLAYLRMRPENRRR